MMTPEAKKEIEVLTVLRKVISGVVRELTPEPNMRHPLSDGMLEDIRQSFILIAAREKEINDAAGTPSTRRPQYTDDPARAKVVQFHGLKKDKD